MDPTVEGFARGEWLDERKISKPFAWKDDLSRLVHHFLPTFGKRRLTWLDTDEGARAIRTWAIELRSHKAQRDGKPLAPRSVWNVYSLAKVLLDDAVDLRRLERNPLASFRTDKHLPHKSDKLDGWRERAGFELAQVVALTTDGRLLPHRRVWNTLAFMVGGGRTGEIANLRWRDWTESHKSALGRLTVATSFNTRAGEEKSTKTAAKKLIPVRRAAPSRLARGRLARVDGPRAQGRGPDRPPWRRSPVGQRAVAEALPRRPRPASGSRGSASTRTARRSATCSSAPARPSSS